MAVIPRRTQRYACRIISDLIEHTLFHARARGLDIPETIALLERALAKLAEESQRPCS